MDYLRNLGSVLHKSGLPFSLGPKVAVCEGLYSLYDATKRVSPFLAAPRLPSQCTGQRLSRLRLRVRLQRALSAQPQVFGPELPQETQDDEAPRCPQIHRCSRIGHLHIHHDRAGSASLKHTSGMGAAQGFREGRVAVLGPASHIGARVLADFYRNMWLTWAQIALTFLNDSCASTHGRICTHSIFISPSGEWKLGGFELLSNPTDDAAVLYVRSNPRLSISSSCYSEPWQHIPLVSFLVLSRSEEKWLVRPQTVRSLLLKTYVCRRA